jgi:IPT/TIG domain-containing protein/laminin G domain protein
MSRGVITTTHRVVGRVPWRSLMVSVSIVGLLGLHPGPAQAVPPSHYWAMNEPAGARTMVDSGGATRTDGTWENIQAGIPGFSGTGYRFNGSTSRVIVADDSSLHPGASPFSVTAHVSFTVIPTSANGGDYDLVRKGVGTTNGGYWKIEAYPASSGTRVTGLCQMKGSINHIKVTGSPSSLNDGKWHTITCTKTDTDVTLTVDSTSYVKSVTIGSITNSAPLTVGAKPGAGGDWYDGDMDEVSYQISRTQSPPTITGFSPTSGPAGTSVTISGTNLTGASSVTFNGIAASYAVNSSTQITATVPSSASTGPISVSTGNGTAMSSTSFTVTAISEVQKQHVGANDVSISLTLAFPPTPGDVLVAAVVVPDSLSPAFDTPTGWTKPFTPARGAVFWRVSNGTERTVTVNLSAGQPASALRMWVVELSGVETTNPFDRSGSAVFSSAQTSVTPATSAATTQLAEWAFTIVAQNGSNGGGERASNGFNLLATGNSRDIAASKVLTATGAVSTTISWTNARAGSWIIATFRAVS